MTNLKELVAAVQYRGINVICDVGWHTMAAFDSEFIAQRYAEDCRKTDTSGRAEYRVIDIEDDQ